MVRVISTITGILIMLGAACLPAACSPNRSMTNQQPLPAFDDWWDYNDPAATEERFREVLPTAKRSGDAAYLAQLRTQIARTLGLQRKFKDAHKMLDQVEKTIAAEPELPPGVQIRYFLERGRVFNSSGDSERALPLFEQAWNIAYEAGEDAYAVDAAHMLAIADPIQAMQWNGRALSLSLNSRDPKARRWAGSISNNIGWSYFERGDYETALTYFNEALEHRRANAQQREVLIARWCIAKCRRLLGQFGIALAEQQALEQAWAERREPDGYVQEEIGECLLAMGRAEEATPHFARAYEILAADPWFAANESQRLDRLWQLAGGAAAGP